MIRKNVLKSVSVAVVVSLLLQLFLLGVSGEVLAAPKKTKLKTKKATVKVGETYAIGLKNKKKKAKYTYKSSNTRVASVSKAGKVKGSKQGTANVTVRQKLKKKNTKVGVLKVTVTREVVRRPTQSPTSSPSPAPTSLQTPVASPSQTPAPTAVTTSPSTSPTVTASPTTTPQATTSPTTTPKVSTTPTTPPKEFEYEGLDTEWIEGIDPAKTRYVAFTFDDGPVGVTSETSTSMQIQAALTEHRAHATFFYVGSYINDRNKEEIRSAKEAGFEIGNHTWNHASLAGANASVINAEVGKTNDVLTELTGYTNFLFRAPYLATNQLMFSNIKAPFIHRSIDTQDYNGKTKDQILDTLKLCNDGDIVLMHSPYQTTANAVKEALAYYDEVGIQVVSVSELFAIKGKKMAEGQLYSVCR